MSRRTHKILTRFLKEKLGVPRFGAEVGVFRGEGSEYLLEHLPKLNLLLVDPWKEWPEGSTFWDHRRIGKLKQDEWDAIHQEVVEKFTGESSPFKNRVVIERMTSVEAAEIRKKAPRIALYDFVYEDSDHTYDALQTSISAWLPLIRKGGLICGDDFGGRCHAIEPAVRDYFVGEEILLPGERIWGVVKR